jgi:hypothetical protein
MTSGCPIWSSDLPARLAAGAAPMFGLIGNRLKRMPDKGWSREFDDPILLPRGRQLVTLEDAWQLHPEAAEGSTSRNGRRRPRR